MANSGVAVSAVVLVVAVAMALVRGSLATNYYVGGPLGWDRIQYNDHQFYQHWAEGNMPFHTSDSLIFIWHQDDSLLLVNQSDFNTCNSQHPIAFWQNQLYEAFSLADHKNQRLYFISGNMQHCAGGQKFYIDVYPVPEGVV